MTLINGDTDDGGAGTGQDGHRCVVNYSITQDIPNNMSTITYAYGVDYGDPNFWANINHRDFTWATTQGSVVGSSGGGTTQTTNTTINTSDPGYGGQTHYFGGVWSGTVTVVHDVNGEAVIRLNASMQFSSGAHDSHITNFDITLPDIVRPPAAPGTPTATRINDGQIDLSWTNGSATHFEYASQAVQRSVDGGAFATIASGLSAGATSYSDTGAAANHKYTYKVIAINAAGSNGSTASTAVYTTPAVPTIGTATKLGNGNVEVSWANNVGYGDTTYGVDVYESQNGGAFNYIDSVAGGLTTWTHVAPSTSVTHAYKTVATEGALFSVFSAATNTVTLLATAGAPTGLSPSGTAADAAGIITLAWTHNPTDGTPQSKRRIQVKVNAGSYSDLVNGTSTASTYDVSAATWTNGDTITWKASTAGQNGTLGTTSAEANFTLSARPTATINAPDATYDTSSLTVEWGYFQAQSSAQAAWQASLFDDADVLIETISGTTETAGTFAHTVADGATYTVTVAVTSAAGLASVADSQTFTVAYALPAGIAIAGVFDNAAGFTVLTLTGDAAVAGYSGLSLDGTGDYATTPDAAALDITGDIDIRLDVELPDWTPAADTTLFGKWVGSGGQRSYEVYLSTAGALKFRLSTDGGSGTVVTATSSATPTPVGGRLSLRVDRNSGVVTFYTSTDTDLTAATWVQLGTTQAAAGTMFSSTAIVRIGVDGGALADAAGTVYSAELRNSSDVVVANPDFANEPAGTTSFADAAGLTWTLAGDAEIVTVGPSTEDIATVDVQRQINGGEWVTILTGVVLDAVTRTATVQDTVPITVGTNTYRAVAYSALPSSVMSDPIDVVTAETTWGYLSAGGRFADVARLRAMPSFTPTTGRAKALYQFAGRGKPVQLMGEALSFTLAVAGQLTSDSGTAADFEALARTQGVVCWRGPDGRRVFGSISPVATPRTRQRLGGSVSFTVTELDFAEGDQ